MKSYNPKKPFPRGVESAEQFAATMEEIWGEDPDDLYNDWHNAITTARATGKYLWPHKFAEKGWLTYGYLYEFADGSRAFVATGGNEVRLP